MIQIDNEPPVDKPSRKQGRLRRSNIAAIAIVCVLVIGVSVGVWLLRPNEEPTGRPLGTAGEVQAYAVMGTPPDETFTIWRDGRRIFKLPPNVAAGYQRFELSSNDVDIAGSTAPDLMLLAWTGGAHCCFTQMLIDGHSGVLLGQLELGNGDPKPFLATKRAGYARAVAANFDDVGAYKFGSYADSPMGRIIIAWDGQKFGLDVKRMKAAHSDSPPDYYMMEPELGDTLALDSLEAGENQASSSTSPPLTDSAIAQRGDRAKTYQAWMYSQEARMRASTLIAGDESSYGPMAAFLNERLYKGQGAAGVASVISAYQAAPDVRDAALKYYFNILQKSRWFDDLNRLNDGFLAQQARNADKAPSHP